MPDLPSDPKLEAAYRAWNAFIGLANEASKRHNAKPSVQHEKHNWRVALMITKKNGVRLGYTYLEKGHRHKDLMGELMKL